MLKRSKISLMAFISVSLVIIILISLYPDFFVNASDFNGKVILDNDFYITKNFSLLDTSMSRSESGFSEPQNWVYPKSSDSFSYGAYNNVVKSSNFFYPAGAEVYLYSDYFAFTFGRDSGDDGNAGNVAFTSVPSGSFWVKFADDSSKIYVPVDKLDSDLTFSIWELSTFDTTGYLSYEKPGRSSEPLTIDGVQYYVYSCNYAVNCKYMYCSSSSCPFYFVDSSSKDITSMSELGDNLNYKQTSSGGSGGGSDSSVFPDGSGGSPANNLYLQSPDFHFSNKKYTPPYSDVINSGDSVPDGSITFNCLLNDYQTSNASNFSLEFSYKLIYNVDYKNHLNNDIGPFKQTSSLLNNKKNLSIPFVSGETSVPLTDFINDNNTYTISFADVFSQLNYDSFNLTGLLAQSREVTSIDYKKFDLYCNVRLVSQGAKSNLYSEWYNPITKKGFLVSDAITDNNNPFVMNPDFQADSNPDSSNIQPDFSVPGSGDSSSSSSSSNNNVVVNNNPTFNNNNNNNIQNDNSTPWLINKLFGAGTVQNGAIGDNKVESLTETTGANNWLEVMKQSFSFVPSSFFNQLALFFGICLGILVVALILRIILDLL